MGLSFDLIREHVRQFAPHTVLIAACSILGAAWGALEINAAGTIDEKPETWTLPQAALPQIVTASPNGISDRFLVDESRAPVKKKVTETTKKEPVNKWRFIGTIDQGAVFVAAIEVNGKRVQSFKVGDTLPDGTIVTKVNKGILSFEREGTNQTMRLFEEKKP
jgi:hypothetical protein